MRFMGDAAAFAYLSMEQAIADSGLTEDQVSNDRTGSRCGFWWCFIQTKLTL